MSSMRSSVKPESHGRLIPAFSRDDLINVLLVVILHGDRLQDTVPLNGSSKFPLLLGIKLHRG